MVNKLKAKYRQGSGKIRRLLLVSFRRRYIKRQLLKRKGECSRCGACCKLLFNCPYLEETEKGHFSCKIHQKRPPSCRIFPVDENDIRDRDSKFPGTTCGYYFSSLK